MMTKDEVKALLATNDKAVFKAIVALEAQQTVTERAVGFTTELNGRGWSGGEAAFGGSLARQISRGQRLSPKQMVCARKMALRHAGQLAKLGTFKPKPTSILGIEERFYRSLTKYNMESVPLHSYDGMVYAIQMFDIFQERC